MKASRLWFAKFVAWPFLVCAAWHVGRAQVLLTVDISDPSSVTFTATGTAPAADATGTYSAPIQFKGFLTANPGATGQATASSTILATEGATHYLNTVLWGKPSLVQTTLSLRNGSSSENFLTTDPAFAGSAAFDFSSISSYLPAAGATGNLVVSTGGSSSGTVIGTYSVTAVPEPADYALVCAVAALVFAVWRRRRMAGTSRAEEERGPIRGEVRAPSALENPEAAGRI